MHRAKTNTQSKNRKINSLGCWKHSKCTFKIPGTIPTYLNLWVDQSMTFFKYRKKIIYLVNSETNGIFILSFIWSLCQRYNNRTLLNNHIGDFPYFPWRPLDPLPHHSILCYCKGDNQKRLHLIFQTTIPKNWSFCGQTDRQKQTYRIFRDVYFHV